MGAIILHVRVFVSCISLAFLLMLQNMLQNCVEICQETCKKLHRSHRGVAGRMWRGAAPSIVAQRHLHQHWHSPVLTHGYDAMTSLDVQSWRGPPSGPVAPLHAPSQAHSPRASSSGPSAWPTHPDNRPSECPVVRVFRRASQTQRKDTPTKTRVGHAHIALGVSGGLSLAWARLSLESVSLWEREKEYVVGGHAPIGLGASRGLRLAGAHLSLVEAWRCAWSGWVLCGWMWPLRTAKRRCGYS